MPISVSMLVSLWCEKACEYESMGVGVGVGVDMNIEGRVDRGIWKFQCAACRGGCGRVLSCVAGIGH